jgi:hypothetical protein
LLFFDDNYTKNNFKRLKQLKMNTENKIRKETAESKICKGFLFFLATVLILTITLN